MSSSAVSDGVKKAREKMYRGLVIEAAERVFAEHGYEDSRIQDIATASGIALGTLYSVFPGKWEVFTAIHEYRGGEVLDAVASSLDGAEAGAVQLLIDGVEAFVQYLIAHPNFLRMHLREGYSWAASTQFKSGEQVAAWERGIDFMASLIAAGQAGGAIADGDPKLMAKMMTALQQVQIADWFEKGGNEPADELIARIQEQLRRSFVLD